jgi:4-amino-4-deoxy-L-arabinose transferase-like glycosyltransferase
VSGPLRRGGFGAWLAAIAALGLAARLANLLLVDAAEIEGDGVQFHMLALRLAEGDGYRQMIFEADVPTADKPPLYPLVLSLPSALGLDSIDAHRVVSCLMGAALVVIVGLLGRRVAGERVGLVAAGIAALHPALVAMDGSLRSESLYAPLIALALLAAYELAERPRARTAALLGAAIGLAALTRSEAVTLIVLLLLPAIVLVPRTRRLSVTAIAVVACMLTISPWVARNWIVLDQPTLSTNSGSLLAGANCQDAYYGPQIGSWPCFPAVPREWGTEEVEISSRLRDRGLEYAAENAERLPAVVAARVMRSFDVWDPVQASRLEAGIGDRALGMQRAGMLVFYALAALAVWGALILRRLGRPLALLLAPLVLVVMISVTGYGTTRFRAGAEVAVCVLAAVPVARLLNQRIA